MQLRQADDALDEAHRATGDYAYATVVRHLMVKNPNFRVLALSATPGGTIEAVQSVIDALHISHIECRHEENLDIARYMKTKVGLLSSAGQVVRVQRFIVRTSNYISLR